MGSRDALRHGFMRGQLDAAGARLSSATTADLETVDVAYAGNASDAIDDGGGLPSTSALDSPTPVCAAETCR